MSDTTDEVMDKPMLLQPGSPLFAVPAVAKLYESNKCLGIETGSTYASH